MPAAPGGDSLDGIALLQGLDPAARQALAARCVWRRYAPGERILDPEADSRDVLFIVSGRVRVVTYAVSGREVAFAVLEAGSHVGELSALDGAPRSASVEALEACRVASLPADAFQELLLAQPGLALELLKGLAGVIRRSDERIAELSVLGAMPRVYRELRRLARPQGAGAVVAPLPTQETLATHVGATRETVARALGQLAKAGIATRRGRELLIRDLALLEALGEPEA
jgi:CRP-like cAMP-binding protein